MEVELMPSDHRLAVVGSQRRTRRTRTGSGTVPSFNLQLTTLAEVLSAKLARAIIGVPTVAQLSCQRSGLWTLENNRTPP